jgi:osmotically-inducible protein OsmY
LDEKEERSMTQSAAALVQPARERAGEETDAAQGTALLRQRSQEDRCLAERVERALRATGYGPLRGIEVTVHGRLVVLGGRVPSYFLKQVAQTTALAVPGARQVRNDLDVSRPT